MRAESEGLLRVCLTAAVMFSGCLALPRTALPLEMIRAGGAEQVPERGTLRVASFNPRLERPGAGVLLKDIRDRAADIQAAARVILDVRPDVLLLNSFDRDPEGRALAAFIALLKAGAGNDPGVDYRYAYQGPVNTGHPSGHDLDGDGNASGPGDALGYGAFPGQYGMALLSRFPLETGAMRSYRMFRRSRLPGADRPVSADGIPVHVNKIWRTLRLSSKSHWDIPLRLPTGQRVRLLAAHPTPPVFDGPEDLNGRRNSDEIRLLGAMIDGPAWLTDDKGCPVPGDQAGPFIILGTLNADPWDGEAKGKGISRLLTHPRVQDPHPVSRGAAEAARQSAGVNRHQRGPAAEDTVDWPDRPPGPGNLRVDYVLPSREFTIVRSGVFWPTRGQAGATPGSRAALVFANRMVWVDLRLD